MRTFLSAAVFSHLLRNGCVRPHFGGKARGEVALEKITRGPRHCVVAPLSAALIAGEVMIMSMSDSQFIFTMLVTFQIKHLIGDYILQTGWMVRGKARPGPAFIWPLTVHVGVHALTTLAIVLVVNPQMWFLAAFDFAVHFIMDRIKSSPRLLGRFTNMNKQSFWIPFGIDQMVHHCTHYFIIWQLFMHR